MEPPCEHGGVFRRNLEIKLAKLLQWSRRVNTAECQKDAIARHRSAKRFNGAAV